MPEPVTFQRLHRESVGLEHTANPMFVRNVLKSMHEAQESGLNPFRVRFRMDDGSVVVVKPKGWVS